MFVAPLFRLSEIQTLLLHAEILRALVRSNHGVETNTALNHPEEARVSRRAFDKTLSKTMRGIWVQSAKCGKASPASEQSPDGKAKEWPRYDLENKCMMALDEFDIHPRKEADRKTLDWERPHFLTKHCFIWLPHSDDTHHAGHEGPSAKRRR